VPYPCSDYAPFSVGDLSIMNFEKLQNLCAPSMPGPCSGLRGEFFDCVFAISAPPRENSALLCALGDLCGESSVSVSVVGFGEGL